MAVLAVIVAAGVAAGMAWSNAWLRAHNERLEREIERADRFAGESNRQRRLAQEREALADRHLHAAQLRLARQACDVGQFERAQEVLLDDDYGPGPAHRDFAWRYLWRFSRRDVALLGRHDAPVHRVELSPDGRILASGDSAGGIILWDAIEWHQRSAPDRPLRAGGLAGLLARRAAARIGRPIGTVRRPARSSSSLWDVDSGRLVARPAETSRRRDPRAGVHGRRPSARRGLLRCRRVRTIRAWDVASVAGAPRRG